MPRICFFFAANSSSLSRPCSFNDGVLLNLGGGVDLRSHCGDCLLRSGRCLLCLELGDLSALRGFLLCGGLTLLGALGAHVRRPANNDGRP